MLFPIKASIMDLDNIAQKTVTHKEAHGMRDLNIIREKKGFISDMDGVIYHGSTLLPGVKEFVAWLKREK